MKISAVIIAHNEADKIARAVSSCQWADEIWLVDSESSDETAQIAKDLGAKIIVQKWLGFSAQKQLAVDRAQNDWIFSLDADEEVSPTLKAEILQLKNLEPSELADGYKIPRLSFYMNRAIRHGGWYPDWQLRFFNRQIGHWKDVKVHESVEMTANAKIAKLSGDIYHFSIENAARHHRIIGERYAPLAAEQMFLNGRRAAPLKIATAGLVTFLQTYFIKAGFLDGFPGFCIARFAAHHTFLKYLLLWEMQENFKKEDKIKQLNTSE